MALKAAQTGVALLLRTSPNDTACLTLHCWKNPLTNNQYSWLFINFTVVGIPIKKYFAEVIALKKQQLDLKFFFISVAKSIHEVEYIMNDIVCKHESHSCFTVVRRRSK